LGAGPCARVWPQQQQVAPLPQQAGNRQLGTHRHSSPCRDMVSPPRNRIDDEELPRSPDREIRASATPRHSSRGRGHRGRGRYRGQGHSHGSGAPPTGVWSGYHGCTVRTRDRRMVMQLPSRRQIRAMMKMKSIRATGGIKDEGDEPSVPGDDNGEKILEWFKVDTNGHPMLDDQGLRIPRSPDTETREPKRRRF
jgi:hypothetical protein